MKSFTDPLNSRYNIYNIYFSYLSEHAFDYFLEPWPLSYIKYLIKQTKCVCPSDESALNVYVCLSDEQDEQWEKAITDHKIYGKLYYGRSLTKSVLYVILYITVGGWKWDSLVSILYTLYCYPSINSLRLGWYNIFI